MAKYIKLNPYSKIVTSLDTFFETHYTTLETLVLRQEPKTQGFIRELVLGKLIKNADDLPIGIVNVQIMNNKYDMKNLKTNRLKRRFPTEQNVDVSPEYFQSEFLDEKDRLEIRVSISQFESKALALAPAKFSILYNTIVGETDTVANAIKSKELISYLWEDSPIVLTTLDFFEKAKPVLDSWVPASTEITAQTLIVL